MIKNKMIKKQNDKKNNKDNKFLQKVAHLMIFQKELQLDKDFLIKCINKNLIKNYKDISKELRSDKEILMMCLETRLIKNYKDIPKELQSDKDFLIKCIEKKIN